tara:strand:- start:8246 stop:8641 length:396 start_codon:yes stop_codon:yes gene_type:complete
MEQVVEVVRAFIYSDDKKFLLLGKRGDIQKFSGMWDLPGCRIAKGESAGEALIRGLKDKLNLEVFSYSHIKTEIDRTEDVRCNVHFFWVLPEKLSDLNLNDANVLEELSWFTNKTMPEYLLHNIKFDDGIY